MVAKSRVSELTCNTPTASKIHSMIEKQKYHCNNKKSKKVLANGHACCPNLSTEAAEVLIPTVLAFFLLKLGFDINPKDFNIGPKTNCLKDIV